MEQQETNILIELALTQDTLKTARGVFDELSALFLAICKNSETHTLAYRLAGVGQHLADDWGCTLEDRLEATKEVGQ